MAFAVFGGPYVHWNQVVGAIPAALVMLRAQPRAAPLLVAAMVEGSRSRGSTSRVGDF